MNVLWFVLVLLQAGDGGTRADNAPRVAAKPTATSPTVVVTATESAGRTEDLSDPAVLARLAAGLESEDASVRERAFEQLALAPKKLVVPYLKQALGSAHEATRLAAVNLVRRHDVKALGRDLVRQLGRDRSDFVRRELCHAVLECAPTQAARALREAMLDDTAIMVRRAAINDLGRLGTIEAAEALVDGYQMIGDEADGEYLIVHLTNALTLATGQSLGRDNLEGWQHFVADMRRLADSAEEGEGEAIVEDGNDEDAVEATIEPVETTVAKTDPPIGGDD